MSASLSTLANVCDTAQKLTTPVTVSVWMDSPFSQSYFSSEVSEHHSLESDICPYIFPRSYSAPSVSDNEHSLITGDPNLLSPSNSFVTVCEHNKKGASQQHNHVPTSFSLEPGNYHDQHLSTITYFNEFPTPPPTPESHGVLPSRPPTDSRHVDPLQRNAIAYAIFQQYLDETWPKDCQRIGGGVIRASLYAKITNTLLGGVAPARLRQWVKRSEFFLTPTSHLNSTDYGDQLAVPVHRLKQRGTAPCTRAGGKTKHTLNNTYRLVAQLEAFVNIIGRYHNDEVGHHGIRKTHAMVSLVHTPIYT